MATSFVKGKYEKFIGLCKKDVKELLGQNFNFYPANVWSYTIKKNFWGRKTVLILYFVDDIVDDFKVLRTFSPKY